MCQPTTTFKQTAQGLPLLIKIQLIIFKLLIISLYKLIQKGGEGEMVQGKAVVKGKGGGKAAHKHKIGE
jgi:hypothetical protein